MNKKERIGRYLTSSAVAGETYKAYIPKPLPPVPALSMNNLNVLLEHANLAIGKLDGVSSVLPDKSLFMYMYIRKEAVLSSQIEGTQSSFSDLLLYEAEVHRGDAADVSSYISAMEHGLARLKTLPLSLRLLREVHAVLMKNDLRGRTQYSGEFRRSQNWIGGTKPGNAKFVPPPVEELMGCLDKLEKFFHDENLKLPTLIKVALIHAQFETIHPFLDGNGRLGRLLITFILCAEGVLESPILYLSLYLKNHRQIYYDHLQSVRETGDWEAWIQFFLTGVVETSKQAIETAESIRDLFKNDHASIEKSGKSTTSVFSIFIYLQKNPLTTSLRVKEECSLSLPTVLRSFKVLENLDIIKEITGKDRNKKFSYKKYLDILNEGTEVR